MSFSSDQALLVNQLPIAIDFEKEDKRFDEKLTLWAKDVGNTANTKTGGLYNLVELFNSNQYFTQGNPNVFRNVYRKTFDMVNLNGGNIGAGATVSFPHNISGLSSAALVYAGCTSTTPTYFSVMGQPTVYLSATNVNFTNPLGVALTAVYVVAEYLKT